MIIGSSHDLIWWQTVLVTSPSIVFPGDGGDTTAGNKAVPHWVDYSIWGPLFNWGCSSAFYKAASTLLSNNGDTYTEHMTEINLRCQKMEHGLRGAAIAQPLMNHVTVTFLLMEPRWKVLGLGVYLGLFFDCWDCWLCMFTYTMRPDFREQTSLHNTYCV